MVTVYVHELDPETEEPYEGWFYGDGQNARDEVAAGPEPTPEATECGEEDNDHDWQARPHKETERHGEQQTLLG